MVWRLIVFLFPGSLMFEKKERVAFLFGIHFILTSIYFNSMNCFARFYANTDSSVVFNFTVDVGRHEEVQISSIDSHSSHHNSNMGAME